MFQLLVATDLFGPAGLNFMKMQVCWDTRLEQSAEMAHSGARNAENSLHWLMTLQGDMVRCLPLPGQA